MTPDLAKVQAHAAAATTLVDDLHARLNALIEAQSVLVQYDKSPMRDMTLQGLARAIVRGQEFSAALSPYTRTLGQYAAGLERAQK